MSFGHPPGEHACLDLERGGLTPADAFQILETFEKNKFNLVPQPLAGSNFFKQACAPLRRARHCVS